jgi:lipoprotein-releasing system ATP-binding protein
MSDFVASKIVKQFPSQGDPLTILAGVDLELNRGDQVAILGESGSGKSTFLHIAGTLDQPTSGAVRLFDQMLNEIPEKKLAAFRSEHIGFIFQQHHLLPQMSALENVLVPTLAAGSVSPEQIERAKGLLESVGLADRMDHRPALLSGGECQRVAVARALINEPALILADEPTGSLDEENSALIGGLLLEIQPAQPAMLICVTHSQSLAAMFGRTKELKHGKFV